MRIGIISGVLGLIVALPVHAQKSDSIKSMLLPDVVVTETYQQRQAKKSALTVEVINQDFLRKHFTGNFMQAMENIPGVQAMDIGSGFSKPMIRGMGFNRIAVLENGVKQEGQQWGADHGLELDAFNIEAVNVLKGPASLLYGSDAMGGVIDITPPYWQQCLWRRYTLGQICQWNDWRLTDAGNKEECLVLPYPLLGTAFRRLLYPYGYHRLSHAENARLRT